MLKLIIFKSMKSKILALIVFITGIFFCGFAIENILPVNDGETKASIEWKETTHDFGKIIKNKPVSVEFEFKNNSLVPLVINYVRPSCGCTVADYPKEPVKPGKTAVITVGFNAKSPGHFTKSIIVGSNATEGNTTLFIKGEVVNN